METDKNRDWALDNEPPTELDNAVNFLNSRKHLQKNGEIDRYAVGRIMLEWASQNASTIESKLPVGSVVISEERAELVCIHDIEQLRIVGRNITCLDCKRTWKQIN